MLGIGSVARKIFGTPNDRKIKATRPLVERINALEPEFQALSDDDLIAKTEDFRTRIADGESLDACCPRPLPTAARRRAVRLDCAPSTCSSWAGSSCIRAISPR